MAQPSSPVSRAGDKAPVRTSILLGIALAILHGYLASIYIDHPPLYDEMYHMLAAESWRASGELRILDGEYLRASLFTKMVGLNANLCGPSLECARGISVAASVLLVFLVTVFSGIVMRPSVGFVAGLLVASNPALVAVSQYVRFYSLHALIFFVIAVLIFTLAAYWRRLAMWQVLSLASLTAALLLFANHLQVLTQLGLLGVLLGAAIILAPDILRSLRHQHPWVGFLLVTAALAIAVVLVSAIDIEQKIQSLWQAPGWAQANADNFLFYPSMLRSSYPALWPMMSVLAILSIAKWPRPSLYFLVAFVSILIVLSIAATKAGRFIVHALPFLLIPMAAGIVAGIQILVAFIEHRIKELSGWHAGHPLIGPALGAIVLVALIFFAIHQPVARDVVRMVTAQGTTNLFSDYSNLPDWYSATDEIRRTIDDYPVVITSSGVKAAYYLGDFSFELNHSVMLETDTGEEFGLDWRTGRQVIAGIDSVLRVVRECGPSLVIGDEWHVQEDTLAALDDLTSRRTPAANLWTWKIDPPDTDVNDVDAGPLDRGPLDCRPVRL